MGGAEFPYRRTEAVRGAGVWGSRTEGLQSEGSPMVSNTANLDIILSTLSFYREEIVGVLLPLNLMFYNLLNGVACFRRLW